MDKKALLELRKADKVLIGIGEEFEDESLMADEHREALAELRQSGFPWAAPALQRSVLEESGRSPVYEALAALTDILKDKDYFVVTSLTNDILWYSRLDQKRIAAPCGGSRMKQCGSGCLDTLTEVGPEEFETFVNRIKAGEGCERLLGTCPECNGSMVFNNIYAEYYDEFGYRTQWNEYMKWLKGTLNKSLCVLELGVGLKYPTIIRWPFEKAALLNNKATLIRVNGWLYQLPEELNGKGFSVQENSLAWLLSENDTL